MTNLTRQLTPWRHLLPVRACPPGKTSSGYVFYLHRNQQEMTLLIVIVIIAAIEGPLVHLLLASWNHTAAWIVSALTVLTIAWVIGFVRAGRSVSSRVDGVVLRLADGLYEELHVQRSEISAWSLEKLGSEVVRSATVAAEPTASAGTASTGKGHPVTRFELSFARPVTVSRFAGGPESVVEYRFDVSDGAAVEWLEGWLAAGSKRAS